MRNEGLTKPTAPNPAIASRLLAGHHWRGVGQDGPDDADHDPAAAFIYAAESLIRDSAESAGYAMSRVVDDAFSRAADDREGSEPATSRVDAFIADCCHPIVQRELRWWQSIFAYVQAHPLSHATITELRRQANA